MLIETCYVNQKEENEPCNVWVEQLCDGAKPLVGAALGEPVCVSHLRSWFLEEYLTRGGRCRPRRSRLPGSSRGRSYLEHKVLRLLHEAERARGTAIYSNAGAGPAAGADNAAGTDYAAGAEYAAGTVVLLLYGKRYLIWCRGDVEVWPLGSRWKKRITEGRYRKQDAEIICLQGRLPGKRGLLLFLGALSGTVSRSEAEAVLSVRKISGERSLRRRLATLMGAYLERREENYGAAICVLSANQSV